MINKHSLISIVDADTLVYLCAYRAKDSNDTDKVLFEVDTFVQLILTNTSCTHYIGFLGGSKETFRNQVSSIYKANRPASPDWYIKWGGVIKAYLRDKWKFQVVSDIEADDAVSMIAWSLQEQSINHIIVGADKDLLQIQGNHYNLRTHTRTYIDTVTADRNLFKQVLLGDVSDNIKGCKGIGKKKASQYIDGLVDRLDMAKTTYQLFENKYDDKGIEYRKSLKLCELLTGHKEWWLDFYNMKLDYIEVPRLDIPDSLDKIIADIWG